VISLLSIVTTFMKPLMFLKGRKICINRGPKEEQKAGLFGSDCNRVFAFEKLIQANLKIPDSVTTVLQVCFVMFLVSFHFTLHN
jgi:hypothetical protein